MSEGWISLHRKVENNYLWLSEKFTRGQAWVDLLLIANHSDGKIRARGILVDVKRGQVGWSCVKLAERWKWGTAKVKRFLNELENEQQIEQQKNNVTTLITIINYNEYQLNGTANRTASGIANEQQIEQQTNSKSTTNNNGNKKNNENKYSDDFEKWWSGYKHGVKSKAFEAWKKQIGKMPELYILIQSTKKYLDYCMVNDRRIKDGQGFLNQRYWENDWNIKTNNQPKYEETRCI